MRKIGTIILILLLISTFVSCGFNDFNENNTTKEYSEVDEMSLLAFLNDNVSASNTLDEIIDVFEEMCNVPIEAGKEHTGQKSGPRRKAGHYEFHR